MLLSDVVGTAQFPHYVDANPEVLIPSGFDEVRTGFLKASMDLVRNAMTPEAGAKFRWDALPLEAVKPIRAPFVRHVPSGVWYFPWLYQPGRSDQTGLPLDTLGTFRRQSDGGWRIVLRSAASGGGVTSAAKDIVLTDDGILRAYERGLDKPSPGAIVLPELFRHPVDYPRIELLESTRALLLDLQTEKVTFAALAWQQVEDVVAELLRRHGLRVKETARRKDGGRDLIVRGELIPGEPCTLAVEIKHRAVVGVDDVASRLQRNKDFPALLFATTGRFTAGVVREKERPENFLRLFLKDGDGLQQWVRAYRTTSGN